MQPDKRETTWWFKRHIIEGLSWTYLTFLQNPARISGKGVGFAINVNRVLCHDKNNIEPPAAPQSTQR